MTGHAYGLRVEAQELLRARSDGRYDVSRPPMSEAEMRSKVALARDFADDEAVALWSRLLWRYFVRDVGTRRKIVLTGLLALLCACSTPWPKPRPT